MRQRVMIGMALSCEPKLLIADEPTTALDVTVQAQILELLKAIQERTGAALMLITHDLGVVAEMVDNVDRDVRGPDRGAGDGRGGPARAADAVHDGPARVDPDRRQARRAAVGDQGRRPVAVPPAARLPLRAALPVCAGRPAGPWRRSCTRSARRGQRSPLPPAPREARPSASEAAIDQHNQNMTTGRTYGATADGTGPA